MVCEERLTVCFLRIGRQYVVVPVEWEKGRELHPPVTKLLVRVAVEPAKGVSQKLTSAKKDRY